mgnify:CR=1 FL=1|tara:strand:+ start:9087 stop:11426 length:2340 start_codon:yes stop_codon:yes gene_type:complete
MSYLSLPKFKLPANSKTKAWAKEVLLYAGNTLSLYSSSVIRDSVENKITNIDLYNGIIHAEDFVRVVNPLDLKTIDTTRALQHYPIAAPIIDLLVGEEINRPYEPLVHVVNNIAIDEKAERLRVYVQEQVVRLEEEWQGDEQALKQEVTALKRKLKYGHKDVVDKKASALLNHYWEELGMMETFVEGYRRMWLTGEEAYEIDIVNNEPTLRVINSVKMRAYGGGNSNRIEDSDIIVVEDHYSSGQLIERYGDKLSTDEIDRILDFQAGLGIYDKPYGDVTYEFKPRVVGEIMGNELSSNYVDSNGNIRHLRVRWKAYKKVKKILYPDPITGVDQIKVVSENYRLLPGEVVKESIWIYDWWIGTLIAADIVVDAHPIPIIYNKLSSLVESHPGIVGAVFNINQRRVTPPMSRMKPYQYLYDVIMDNIIVAMSKNIGPILEMDMAKKPTNWDTQKWLGYMTRYNVKFTDSFKEVKKGPAMGQLAGNVAQGHDQLVQLDFGNYIQQLINLGEYLENAMSEVVGVMPQRKGAVSNRETVGGIERATSQSSHMTEWSAFMHSQLKSKVLNVFIEAAKHALKDNPKKLQNIVDGSTREILEVTEEDFINADLGVFVTNSTKANAHKQILEQAAQAYMQNGGEFSFVFDVLFSDSMSEKRRLIEEHEENSQAQAQEQSQADQAAFKAEIDSKKETEDKKLEMDKYRADLDAEIKIKLKEMDMQMNREDNMMDGQGKDMDYKANIMSMQKDMDKNFNDNQNKQAELGLKDKELNIKKQESKAPASGV